ncbi:uncharacterized protein SAPINGB_P002289 [Magnusiomyces paraingens]|uniref:DNA replication complex GINS protein PSF2 n=1 Tax=Magnusiomyces paraingens TaxID=2606893 RepID=A0A5E8BDF7_9ASCO|nr:uncharacterized protein SAPINGB_P002289 [Saprochaete ingens]VVT49478.1 unnamed protein product [Saprochaete ingens]
MALPPKLAATFLPSELFFLAEDTQITIVPRQALGPIQLIGIITKSKSATVVCMYLKETIKVQLGVAEARDDLIAPANIIRGLIRDLREVRQAKARAGIKELNESHMRMDNMGTLELNELRQFMAGVMDELQRLIEPLEEEKQDEDMEDDDDDNDLYE